MNSMTQTLSLHDITKDFGGGPVLAGITLDITPGELVAIMGPSGSGKSTLLHCMSGVLTPTDGSVRFGDADISTLSDAARSRTRLRHFGFVFQDGQLLPELTNLDNVALPAMLNGMGRRAARSKALSLLDQLGLGDLADRRPAQVSGGQAQRVNIARALMDEPNLLLADEPTSALDSHLSQEIIRLLRDITQEMHTATVLVTHDRSLLTFADHVVEVQDGRVSKQEANDA